MPSFDPRSYNDVLKDLTYWGGILLAPLFYVVSLILPPELRKAIGDFTSTLPAGGLLPPLITITVIAVIAVYLFKIHDVYDSHVLRWREAFDLDFIVPALVRPLSAEVHPDFLALARANRRVVMNRLFYHFVRDGSPKIEPNLVTRFYGRIARYWVTVLNEITLLLLIVIAAVSGTYEFVRGGDARGPIAAVIVGLLLVLINRRLMGIWLASVKRASEEELEAIIEDKFDDLRTQVADIHRRLKLTFPEP